jgi:uncharacterized BrkB/YihY/UPF0761 family membrane protein
MALLIWFFLSALAVLVGGVIDASLERRHRERSSANINVR